MHCQSVNKGKFKPFHFSAGGSRKLSMAELEDSIAQIKAMLKERSDIIDNLTPPIDY